MHNKVHFETSLTKNEFQQYFIFIGTEIFPYSSQMTL